MAANTAPIFSKTADIQWAATNPVTTLMTNATGYDGTDANCILCYTADATNGGFVSKIRLKCKVTTGTSTATVMRFFVNNGSTNGTAANNSYIGEVSLPNVSYTITAATNEIDYPLNIALPPGYRIYCGLGTSTTNGGWMVTVFGAKY